MFKVLKISGIQKIFTLWITVIWRGELKTIGITQGSVLGPSSILFPWYTKSMGFVIHSHGLSNHLCRDDTQQIQFHILKPSLQLKYLCNWPTPPFWEGSTPHLHTTPTPHLSILDNSELLFLPRKASPIHNCIACDSGAMNLGVTLDDQLAFCSQHCYDHRLLQISAIQHHEDNYVPHITPS